MDHRIFDETVSTPNPEDYLIDSATDFSWIMDAVEVPQGTGLQSAITENRSYLAELEACFPNFNCPPVPDVVPSASLDELENKEEQIASSPLVMSLEPSDKSDSNEIPMAVKNSDYDLWMDSRWNPVTPPNPQPWPSQIVSCYSTLSSQTIGTIIFFIDCGDSGWTPSSMVTTVLDENNNQLPVEMNLENIPLSHRYICTFSTHTPGSYSITVRDTLLNLHVKGSPFQLSVSRNYKMCSTWKPRVFQSKAGRAWGVAYSATAKRVYVTDRDAHQIVVYHENGILDKCFGTHGQNPDQFYRPTGIAVDNHNQRLVITDKDNHRVGVYSLVGQFIFTFGNKGFKDGEFNYPWGVSVSPKDSTIAIADSRNHRIQLFDCNGNFLSKYSVFETRPFEYKTEFNYPRGISFDKTGENVYVADFNIQTIFKLNIKLTEKSIIVPPKLHLSRPQGIAIDSAGNILICDSRNNCIRVISPEGEKISSIVGHATNSFLYPQDLTVVPTGEILVVDSHSNIRVL